MFKKLLLFTSLSAVLLLTGCITLEIQNIIHADESGEKVMITALDTDAYDMLTSVTPTPGAEAEDPLESLMTTCQQDPRATCAEYTDEERELTGVRASIPFNSLDELVGLSSSPIFNDADEITFERSGDTTVMHIVLHTKDVGSEVAEGSGQMEATPVPEATLTPEEEEMQRQALAMMDINFYYRVTAPSPIISYEPTENATYDEETNTVSWKIDLLSEEPTSEFELTWGGAPIGTGEEKATMQPTQEATEEPEATEKPEATSEPSAPQPTEEAETGVGTGPGKLCSCLPSAAVLPALALGSVLLVRRRRGLT